LINCFISYFTQRPLSCVERERAPGSEKGLFLLYRLENKKGSKLKRAAEKE
jgi:hypothetical protein